jgi:signal transduction histidine kinase
LIADRKSGGKGRRRAATSTAAAASSREDLSLLHEIAEAANESADPRRMVGFTLETLCRRQGWSVGHAFTLRSHPEPHLRSAVWKCAEPSRFRSFRRLTRKSTFRIGEGMVGKIARTRRPRWIENVATSSPPVRFSDVGPSISSGLILPVVVRPEPHAVAVLELFSERRRRPGDVQLRLTMNIVAMLVRVFERERNEQRLAAAREAEQRRIGRELHDTISQDLTGITMMAERLSEEAAERGSPHAARLEKLTEHVQRTRDRVHALSRGLLPLDVGGSGLRSALEFLVANVRELHGLDCRLECDEYLDIGDAIAANHLARIAQEAIQNAAKHAAADSVTVHVSRRGQRFTLAITDDGKGFSARRMGEGVGLRLMRHRAATIGADLSIRSRAGRGTNVRCTWEI